MTPPVETGDAAIPEGVAWDLPCRRRLASCVEEWPECVDGDYDPHCCRFPKSCSCLVYSPEEVTEADLEPYTDSMRRLNEQSTRSATATATVTAVGDAAILRQAAERVRFTYPIQEALREPLAAWLEAEAACVETMAAHRDLPQRLDALTEGVVEGWEVVQEISTTESAVAFARTLLNLPGRGEQTDG